MSSGLGFRVQLAIATALASTTFGGHRLQFRENESERIYNMRAQIRPSPNYLISKKALHPIDYGSDAKSMR